MENRSLLSASITLPASVDVAEDAASSGDYQVATFTATDADSVDITAGNAAGHFYIDMSTHSIMLSSAVTIDNDTQDTYQLTLTAFSYMDSSQDTADITINVLDTVSGGGQTYSLETRYDWDHDGSVDDNSPNPTDDLLEMSWWALINDDDDGMSGSEDYNDDGPIAYAEDDLRELEITITSNEDLSGHAFWLKNNVESVCAFSDSNKTRIIDEYNPIYSDATTSTTFTFSVLVEATADGTDSLEIWAADLEGAGEVSVPYEGMDALIGVRFFGGVSIKHFNWMKAIRNEYNMHKKYTYFKVTGLDKYLAKAYSVIPDVALIVPGLGYSYQANLNKLTQGPGPLATHSVIHEATHVIDDFSDWYLPDTSLPNPEQEESSEALAWGAQHLIEATSGLRNFEDQFDPAHPLAITTANYDTRWKIEVIMPMNNVMGQDITWTQGGGLEK